MKSVGEAMAIGRTFAQAFLKAMRSRELDVERRPRRRRSRSCSSASRSPGASRYDELLEALRRGATIERAARADVDRPVVPARVRGDRAPTRRRASSPACAPSSRSTPAPPSSRRARPTTTPPGSARPDGAPHEVARGERAERRDPRLRAQPDRPGDRVRLLLRARRDDRARVRPRRGDDQLQPGDGLDRLRHLRPPLLRAADARGRARRDRARAARGRDRPVRRPDAAAPRRRPRARRRAPARHERRRDRRRRGPRPLRRAARRGSATRRRRTRPRARSRRRSRRRRRSASRCSCARATCSAGARWRSSTRARTSPATCSAQRRRADGREIFLDRFLENAIEVDVDALCDGARSWIGGIMQHVEEAGIHSGDSACVLPPHSLGAEMLERIREQTRGIALELGVVGLLNVQFAVVSRRARRRRALRDRGQPARLAHRAVRLEGDRPAAREARLPADARRVARRARAARATR